MLLRVSLARCVLACAFAAVATALSADPLSKKFDLDFFRDVPSRNLKGLATRADGRLIAGPSLTELSGTSPADLLWTLEPGVDGKWLVGSGPDGRIFEVTLDFGKNAYTTRELVKLDDPHVFSLLRLPNGSILAGTSPKGGFYLIRDGKVVSRITLPVDSIFDVLPIDDKTALIATGNPGRIYRLDLAKFATVGVVTDKITDPKILAERGVTLFGEIRDRNVRTLARFPDGRVIAGSAPKGNIYVFPRDGAPIDLTVKSPSPAGSPPLPADVLAKAAGSPVILQENRDAEVTDLLPQPNGDLFATIIFASSSGESRINRAKPATPTVTVTPAPAPIDALLELSSAASERFSGRSSLVSIPANRFPETLITRTGLAFYHVVRHGDQLLVSGGDSGDVLGYDLQTRNGITFAGSVAAQLNGLAPLPGNPGRFLLLKNNAPGFAVLDFAPSGSREAETRRLDLGQPGLIGALRFNRLRSIASAQLTLSLKTNFGSDETEGWTAWTPLSASDGGWRAEALRGRYAKLRLQVPAGGAGAPELDRASLYYLPQNRRPILADFHVLSPNYGLILAPDPAQPSSVSLSQLVGGSGSSSDSASDAKRRNAFLASQVVPQTGTQLVLWTVTDADNDTLASTFSVRRDGDSAWTDIAVQTHDSYAQFDIGHLPEGTYFTRLVVTEQAPRPVADRLTTTFETDDLIIDRTPPEILEATAKRAGNSVVVTVHGRGRLSLLDSADFNFNNGVRESVEQPVDGIRDGREESFALEVPVSRIGEATSVEVILYDACGNSAAKRLTW